MRERPLTIFFVGFVFGLIFLAVLLRQTGMLRTVRASAAPGRLQAFPVQRARSSGRAIRYALQSAAGKSAEPCRSEPAGPSVDRTLAYHSRAGRPR